jgi:hypothetical protein
MEINSIETLNQLLQKKKRKDIVFSFPGLSDSENERWQKKISKDYYACGCETGTVFLLVAVTCTVSYLALHRMADPAFSITFKKIIYSMLIVFIVSGTGKAVGLLIAKNRLKQNIHLLKTIVSE